MNYELHDDLLYIYIYIYTGNVRQGLLPVLGHHSSPLSVTHYFCPSASLRIYLLAAKKKRRRKKVPMTIL